MSGGGRRSGRTFVLISWSLEGQNKRGHSVRSKDSQVKYAEDCGYTAKTHSLCWFTFSPCVLGSEPDSGRKHESLVWQNWSPGRTGLRSTSFGRPVCRSTLMAQASSHPHGIAQTLEGPLPRPPRICRSFLDIFTVTRSLPSQNVHTELTLIPKPARPLPSLPFPSSTTIIL